MLLLVPADPLHPPPRGRALRGGGRRCHAAGHDVALVDHDALTEPDGASRAAARVPEGGGTAVYRGWMLASAQYAALAGAEVAARGSAPKVVGEQRRHFH
ncbi:MAG: hypothetical protein ACRDNW_15250 [Trebonia sp.]